MTNLEKDKAIYDEMLKIAREIFQNAASKDEVLRKELAKNGGSVSLTEINKHKSWFYNAINNETPFPHTSEEINMVGIENLEHIRKVSVGGFRCFFPPMDVFRLLAFWKKEAKVRGDVLFKYEAEAGNRRKFITEVKVPSKVFAGSENLVECTVEHELRPTMAHIYAEFNMTAGTSVFAASSGKMLGVVSDSPSRICEKPQTTDEIYTGLIRKEDWKRICEYAKKHDEDTSFKIYEWAEEESECDYGNTSALVITYGDSSSMSVPSEGRFPNFRSVISGQNEMEHVTFTDKDAREFSKYISKMKGGDCVPVTVSAYKGSDILYVETEGTLVKYQLTKPSKTTGGAIINVLHIKKMKPTGFWIGKGYNPLVDTPLLDLLLIAHCNDGVSPARLKDEREVYVSPTATGGKHINFCDL